jgi:hypothetical protein
MAKGQQKSNREAKKPKKSASDKLKAATPAAKPGEKVLPKKS